MQQKNSQEEKARKVVGWLVDRGLGLINWGEPWLRALKPLGIWGPALITVLISTLIMFVIYIADLLVFAVCAILILGGIYTWMRYFQQNDTSTGGTGSNPYDQR